MPVTSSFVLTSSRLTMGANLPGPSYFPKVHAWIGKVLARDDLSPRAKLLAALLAIHARSGGLVRSERQVAQDLAWKDPTEVKRAAQELCERGLIEVYPSKSRSDSMWSLVGLDPRIEAERLRAMGFFDPPPPQPEPPEPQRYRMPDWFGPPENYAPGLVALELLLVHNKRVAVVIPEAEVYPTGALLRVVLHGRQPARPGVEAGEGTWRFGVRFSDGRKAMTYGLGMFSRPPQPGASRWTSAIAVDPNGAPPEGPVLSPRGAAGSRTNFRQEHWMWPLPPPGDLVIACEWPNLGLELTTVTTDANRIIDAAARAQELWPLEDLPEFRFGDVSQGPLPS